MYINEWRRSYAVNDIGRSRNNRDAFSDFPGGMSS